jgi:hypothetical protein
LHGIAAFAAIENSPDPVLSAQILLLRIALLVVHALMLATHELEGSIALRSHPDPIVQRLTATKRLPLRLLRRSDAHCSYATAAQSFQVGCRYKPRCGRALE